MLPLDTPLSTLVNPSFGSPSNLKEAIDWILRVTGKDGQDSGNGTPQLAKAVEKLLKDVESSSPEIQKALVQIKGALGTPSTGLIDNLATGLAKFIGYQSPGSSNEIGTEGIAVGRGGTTAAPYGPEDKNTGKGYKLTYDREKATWEKQVEKGGGAPETKKIICAKIFLGCLPLYFQALTYIYWGCHENGGGWKDQTLANGALKSYFDSQGFFSAYVDTNKRGSQIAETALQKFSELQQGMREATSSLTSANSPYVKFTEALKKKVEQNSASPPNFPNDCPLSALFYGASCYFRYQQMTNAKSAINTPKTIREMLYFLAALHFSPQYDGLEKHIGTLLTTELSVADSGLQTTKNKLSADQIQECLTASCAFSSCVLGLIQGTGATEKSDPWLFELFCNSAFQFKYPSAATLFSTVSSYAYALQFKLHFLYQQCSNTYAVGCGWRHCRFGKGINSGSNNSAPSHICPGFKCKEPFNCQHNGTSSNESTTECTHNQGGYGAKCGTHGKAFPLQAFLTDNLQGFRRGHSGTSDHLASCSSNSMCHVPMGFNPNDLRTASNANTQGSHISVTLRAFCGGFNTPLRQLSEKLGCLTKRTPQTLGDLFGFLWHLNSQLFKSGKTAEESLSEFFQSLGFTTYPVASQTAPSTFYNKVREKIAGLKSTSPSNVIETALSLFPGLPFWYNLFMVNPDDSLPAVLFKVKNIPHQAEKEPKYSGRHNDLYSLYNPECKEKEKNCGPYLFPLTHSDGAAYNPAHASTYLSWVLYLSDDLQSWFQEMLDEFRNIDCKVSGCVKCKDGTHKPGEHGVSTNCSCDSVVQCGGTLPLLYRHGFRYFNPAVLMGGNDGTNETKRTCKAFADQLQSVLAENAPLAKLLETIDAFLYMFRIYFFYNLSSFWLCSLAILLYFLIYGIDVLHVKSHVHLPSSQSTAHWPAHHRQSPGTNEAHILHAVTKVSAI